MKKIYDDIAFSAKKGNSSCCFHNGDASKEELEVLRANGFTATYETSETDGGQFIVVKW